MESLSMGISILSDNQVKRPPIARTPSHSPTSGQLDAIELPSYGLIAERPSACNISQAPLEPSSDGAVARPEKLGTSRTTSVEASSVEAGGGAGIVPSWSFPKLNKWRHLAACLEYFANGLNDSAPGPLIHYIESSYHIGYAVVSLIWVSNAIGFITAAFFVNVLNSRLGRAKSLMLAEVSMIAAYAIIASPVPFPVVVIAYALIGFGEAVQIALNNVFCSNLANPTVILGAAHGSYGVGGILGPIIATLIVSRGISWHWFFLVALGIRLICIGCVGWSFWKYEEEEQNLFGDEKLVRVTSRSIDPGVNHRKALSFGKVLRNRTVIIGAMFIFAYQGTEVSEAGWFISYLIAYRNANPTHVGYVTSGFWGGITVGRFVLTHAARRMGERSFVFAVFVGVVIFQLLAWLLPNVIGESVAVSIVGLLLGPVYPCAQTIFSRLLPRAEQVFAIGFISSAGSSGGAVVPFLTGLLAQTYGTFVLNPICIAFCFVCVGCWAGLPRLVKRTD